MRISSTFLIETSGVTVSKSQGNPARFSMCVTTRNNHKRLFCSVSLVGGRSAPHCGSWDYAPRICSASHMHGKRELPKRKSWVSGENRLPFSYMMRLCRYDECLEHERSLLRLRFCMARRHCFSTLCPRSCADGAWLGAQRGIIRVRALGNWTLSTRRGHRGVHLVCWCALSQVSLVLSLSIGKRTEKKTQINCRPSR